LLFPPPRLRGEGGRPLGRSGGGVSPSSEFVERPHPRPPLRLADPGGRIRPPDPTARLRRLREGYRDRLRVSASSNVKQPLLFRHGSSPPLFAARGRRRLLHSRPLVRGRAERRMPVAPLGLMRCGLPQLSVHQDFRRRRASARRSACGVFSVACTLPRRTLRSRIKVPRRWEGSLKRVSRTRFDLVVRHTVQGSVHLKAGRLLASGSAGADPSCPKTDVPP
jgi:hypothetical protein